MRKEKKKKTNKMADKKDEKEKWKSFAKGISEKRMKKALNGQGKGVGVGENILSEKEMIIQHLSSEASGKAMKYERLGPQEFVTYPFDEVSLENIKKACYFHFKDRLTHSDMVCDILATQNGPSCTKLSHLPNFKKLHVRFVVKQDEQPASKRPKLSGDMDMQVYDKFETFLKQLQHHLQQQ